MVINHYLLIPVISAHTFQTAVPITQFDEDERVNESRLTFLSSEPTLLFRSYRMSRQIRGIRIMLPQAEVPFVKEKI